MQFVNVNTLLFAVFTLMSIVQFVIRKYNEMKNIGNVINAFVVLAIVFILIRMSRVQSDTQNDIKDLHRHIDSVMVHRSMLDSLYWDHLEVCKFELKDGIVAVEN